MKKVTNQVVIQARTGSTRLPGKVMLELSGRPVLEYVVKRSEAASKVDRVVVATTDNAEDDKIEAWCRQNAVFCVRGSSDDVLSRYIKAVGHFDCENVIRVTADCPLVDPGILDSLLSLHERSKADYTSNVIPPSFPAGLDAEVVRASVLKKVDQIAGLESYREHVTLFIREHTDDFKIENLTSGLAKGSATSQARLTLDRIEDYRVLKLVFKHLPKDSLLFSYYRILEIIEEHKEILAINSSIDRLEGLKKSLKEENRELTWE